MRGFIAFLLIGLTVGSLAAQDTRSAHKDKKAVHIVGIRYGHYVGMCTGYCGSDLAVELGEATLLDQYTGNDKLNCRDMRVRSDISDKRWKELLALINPEKVLALPDRIGCPGCADEEAAAIEVRFSDKTKKSVAFDYGDTPPELVALLKRLDALESKLAQELPAAKMTRCR